MPYLGNAPSAAFQSVAYQDLTGGTGTSFTLSHAVSSAQEIEVFVNNVRQEPTVAYTVAGTALTMTGTIAATDDFYVVFQGKAVGSVSHPTTSPLAATTGTFSGNVTSSGTMTATSFSGDGSALTGISSPSYALLEDQKTAGTTGGTSQTSFTKRDLNTEVYDPDGIVSISSNQFTLGAGTYLIEWACPAYATGDNETRLYNATTSTSAAVGMSVWADNSGDGGSAVVPGKTVQTLTGSTTFEIQHRSTYSVGSGFGNPNDLGGICVYTQVMITKIA